MSVFSISFVSLNSILPWLSHILFIHSSTDGHLSCLYFLAIIHWIMVLQIPIYCFYVGMCFHFSWVFRNEIAEPYGNSMFNFLRNCQTVFQSRCTILHSASNVWRNILFLHILIKAFFSGRYKVVSHCINSFDLCFPNDWWFWTSFHMLILVFHFVTCLFKFFAHF